MLFRSDETLLGKVGVFTGGNVAHQIIPKRVGAVFIGKHKWINDVADALTHLCAAEIPPAVNEQLGHLIIRESDGVQHDEPVDAVGRNKDVFADNLQRRPFVAES